MHWPRSQVSGYLSLTAPTNVPIASPFTSVTQRQLIQETIDIDTVSILPTADTLNSRVVEPFAYYPSLSSLLCELIPLSSSSFIFFFVRQRLCLISIILNHYSPGLETIAQLV
ncbi:hypothetical protein Forpi1262_v002742 [Fusarium oxysporum f. sp. raphani]|uniref:Uncharacterized protein n=1 Tax=Fusarium oxysporum f. sp. raphani TaxID=96318 RepID=A0A8J5Q7R9_FUSOX|nr:hypothetical protein Forpi1262_v002742 [Fusarium oxysporum f. sp. raphani]